jgi:hypothetical protein
VATIGKPYAAAWKETRCHVQIIIVNAGKGKKMMQK